VNSLQQIKLDWMLEDEDNLHEVTGSSPGLLAHSVSVKIKDTVDVIRATQFFQSPVVSRQSSISVARKFASEQGPPKTLSSTTDDC
jgi:hypothetical protein